MQHNNLIVLKTRCMESINIFKQYLKTNNKQYISKILYFISEMLKNITDNFLSFSGYIVEVCTNHCLAVKFTRYSELTFYTYI